MISMDKIKAAMDSAGSGSTSQPKPSSSSKRPPTSSSKASTSTARPSNVRTKVVVRRLPPNLPEAIFWKSVEPWVTEETTTWRVFYQGKIKQKLNTPNTPSRAYISFKTPEQLASFSSGYDGHIFRDKQGNESQALVEFAPYQKVPVERKKADPRQGTIDEDEDYLSFMKSLESPTEGEGSGSAADKENAPPAEAVPAKAPLIEALLAEKAGAKARAAALTKEAHLAAAANARKAVEEEKQLFSRKLPDPTAASTSKAEDKAPSRRPARAAAESSEQDDAPVRRRVGVAGQLRQFEAALSAAAPGAGGPPRRDRRQESISASSTAAASTSSPASASAEAPDTKGKAPERSKDTTLAQPSKPSRRSKAAAAAAKDSAAPPGPSLPSKPTTEPAPPPPQSARLPLPPRFAAAAVAAPPRRGRGQPPRAHPIAAQQPQPQIVSRIDMIPPDLSTPIYTSPAPQQQQQQGDGRPQRVFGGQGEGESPRGRRGRGRGGRGGRGAGDGGGAGRGGGA